MKLHIELNGLQHDEAKVEQVLVDIEYSVEEFIAMMKAYPEVVTTLLTAMKDMQRA